MKIDTARRSHDRDQRRVGQTSTAIIGAASLKCRLTVNVNGRKFEESHRLSAQPPWHRSLGEAGTAEYGSSKPLKSHAWLIATQDDLAVAVFVNDGKSGSDTVGPLLRRFLAKAS